MRARAIAALALGLGLTLGGRAQAHDLGISYGDYAWSGEALRAELIFAHRDLASLVAGLDADHDGALTQAELDAGREPIQGALVGRIKVEGGSARCAGSLDRAEITELDGVVVRASFRCPRRPANLTITLALLADLHGHRHLTRAHAAAGPLEGVLTERFPSLSLALPPEPPRPLLRARHAATATALLSALAAAFLAAQKRRLPAALALATAIAATALALYFP